VINFSVKANNPNHQGRKGEKTSEFTLNTEGGDTVGHSTGGNLTGPDSN